MFRYSKSTSNQFKNYHLKGNQLLTVFLDASGNTVIRVYDAATFTSENEINLECKTFNIFFYPGEDVLAYFPLQRLIRVDLQSRKTHAIEELKFAPEILVDNSLLGISVDESSNKFLARMDLATNKLSTLIQEPFRLWGSHRQDVYGVKIGKGQDVYSINSKSGSINWHHDFGTNLSGRVLSYNEMVVVIGHSILFGLNASDGEIVWKNALANSLTNFYKNKLINVTASYYREISLETGKILTEFEMKSEYEQHGFRFMGTNRNFTVTETHVFIVDAMSYKMGCINRSTGEIDWSVEVGEGKVTLPNAPIVYWNKLYVLDHEGTLHVYEKE
jgi:hypothetical protein